MAIIVMWPAAAVLDATSCKLNAGVMAAAPNSCNREYKVVSVVLFYRIIQQSCFEFMMVSCKLSMMVS